MKSHNTFILYWNPQISNFKDAERSSFVQALRNDDFYEFNWAVWDWQEAKEGDRFFRIRCGMPNPQDDGVIDSGYFTSDPFVGEDWSGKGREVHYAEMEFDKVIDYNHCPVLSSDKLDLRIPHFDWHGGHSGRLLDEQSAEILEELWEQHIDALLDDEQTSGYVYDEFTCIQPNDLIEQTNHELQELQPLSQQIIEDFAEGWRKMDAELIIKHLADEFRYDSQWVFESLDRDGYANYLRGKFCNLKSKRISVLVDIVSETRLKLTQRDGSVCYYRIQVKDGKVIKGDMCMS